METKSYNCVFKDDLGALKSAVLTQGPTDIRLNIFTSIEFEEMLKQIGTLSKVAFRTSRSASKDLKRFVWSKSYMCCHVNSDKDGVKTR